MTGDLRKSLRHEAVQTLKQIKFLWLNISENFYTKAFQGKPIDNKRQQFFQPDIILKSEMHTSVKTNPVYFVMIKLTLEATAP